MRLPGGDMPPSKGSPPPAYPITVDPKQRAVAPVPINDRFPLVVGQSLSVSYIASTARLATTGYRLQWVDLLNELLEQDPHLYAVVQKRILSTANGRFEIVALELDEDDPNAEAANELAEFVRTEVARIPDLTQSLASLMWAVYYGLSACEIFWTRDADGWHVERLGFVHSRRLAYPDYQSWDLYVWDQGQVYGWQSPWGTTPTNAGIFGTRIADWPGKFVVYAPQVRGDYPTRDGLGRQVAVWAAFKRISARGAVEYLERFAKPIMDIAYATQADGQPREASEEDIALANEAARQIGPGSGSGWVHPDSVKLDPKNADAGKSKLTYREWIDVCNGEHSKAVLGSTLGTDVGRSGGNRALGEVQERGEVDLEQYDATTLAEALDRDLIRWIVRLNRPAQMHLCPRVKIHIDREPDAASVMKLAADITSIGGPVDLDGLADDIGVPLVPNDTGKPRRSYRSDFADPLAVDPTLESEEAKAEKADELAAKQELAKTKLQQPPAATNGAPPAAAPPSTN